MAKIGTTPNKEVINERLSNFIKSFEEFKETVTYQFNDLKNEQNKTLGKILDEIKSIPTKINTIELEQRAINEKVMNQSSEYSRHIREEFMPLKGEVQDRKDFENQIKTSLSLLKFLILGGFAGIVAIIGCIVYLFQQVPYFK